MKDIVCGDSLEYLKNIQENTVDLVFTSPPYNFNMDYDKHDDNSSWDEYFEMLFKILKECHRTLKDGGRMIINVQPLYSDFIPTHHKISSFLMEELNMLWKTEIIWEKNHFSSSVCAWGSYMSPSNPYLKGTWEFVEVFCKGTQKHSGDKTKADITSHEFQEFVKAKWVIAPEKRMKEFGHPAMFPPELVYRALKLFTYKDDLVLDPFNGVGTTTLVADRLDRNYIGIDISEEYCNIAKNRLKTEVVPDFECELRKKVIEKYGSLSKKETKQISGNLDFFFEEDN
jgi:DNA modification methylase